VDAVHLIVPIWRLHFGLRIIISWRIFVSQRVKETCICFNETTD